MERVREGARKREKKGRRKRDKGRGSGEKEGERWITGSKMYINETARLDKKIKWLSSLTFETAPN